MIMSFILLKENWPMFSHFGVIKEDVYDLDAGGFVFLHMVSVIEVVIDIIVHK